MYLRNISAVYICYAIMCLRVSAYLEGSVFGVCSTYFLGDVVSSFGESCLFAVCFLCFG